jgi:L-threonylcarbamoyladenylate synthase
LATMNSAAPMLPPSPAAIRRAAEILRNGGLVAFPTETVYGLGADATNDTAVASIFTAKKRPRFNPLIVHLRNLEHAATIVVLNPIAERLAEAFWPGPLTLVLPRRSDASISLLASAGLDTIAVRAPVHPIAQSLLIACGLPIAAPSANLSERVSATTASHVAEELGANVKLILDGGGAPLGLESTVIGFESGKAVLLRPGALPRADIEAVLGQLHVPKDESIRSPGQLRRHYAPRKPLRLDAHETRLGEALLTFGANAHHGARLVRNLSRSASLTEAAANLFAMLRDLDAADCTGIAVTPIPDHGLGEAINDRLRRAATPPDS